MALDNGKGGDYLARKTYSTNGYCFECQAEGHVSYKCPKNVLGIREPPPPTNKKRKPSNAARQEEKEERPERGAKVDDDDVVDPGSSSSGPTIADNNIKSISSKRIKFAKDSYFSDEEEEVCE